MKIKKWLIIPLLAMSLVACGGGGNKNSSTSEEACVVRTGTTVNNLLTTPITDSFKFAQADSLEGKKFAGKEGEKYDHMGYVSLRSCTDGDTANFIQEGYKDDFGAYISIKTRFLGINTPESTAKVEPWGKKASLFVKHILEAAQADADERSTSTNKVFNIALINNPGANFEEKDSSGNRWLAFVWYRPTAESDWRLLNLEVVEQAYSRNQLFTDDPVCNYRSYFEQAETRNSRCKYRLYGEEDPDYDYEEESVECSLWYIINHYDEIGITDEGSSGKQLIVTALVVGVQGDNMFLRDILLDKEQVEKEGKDAKLAGLYAYAGYNSALCSSLQAASKSQGLNDNGLGVIVRFFCRATKYNGNIQLSDVKSSTTGKKAFRTITEKNFDTYSIEYDWSYKYSLYEDEGEPFVFADLERSYDSIHINPSDITTYNDPLTEVSYDDLNPYHYQFIDTEVTIRSVTNQDMDEDGGSVGSNKYWYKGNANDKSYTIYATINGKDGAKILTNLRVDASLYPFIEAAFFGTSDATDLTSEKSPVGKAYHVTGYMALYFDKYQILLPNNYADMNYLYKI